MGALALPALACLDASSLLIERPRNPVIDEAITRMWTREILRIARPGDWLLSRSYSMVGDGIVLVTSGEEISHSVLVDPDQSTVIEAVMPAVHEILLVDFVRRNRYVLMVRPRGTDRSRGRRALARARAVIGAGFDLGGLIGLGRASAYYCSELLYWASGVDERGGARPLVITPADLLVYGTVVYFSGHRDDRQIQRVAAGWLAERATPAERRAAGLQDPSRSRRRDRVPDGSAPAPVRGLVDLPVIERTGQRP